MARVPTTPAAVLAAIETRVGEFVAASLPTGPGGDGDVAAIWLTLASDEEVVSNPPHDRFVTLRPAGFKPDNAVVAGAGWDPFVTAGGTGIKQIPVTMPLAVDVWVQLLVDEQGADDQYLTHSTLGTLYVCGALLGALQGYDPTDAGGNKILTQAMRLGDAGVNVWTRSRRGSFGKLASVWDVPFVWDLAAAQAAGIADQTATGITDQSGNQIFGPRVA